RARRERGVCAGSWTGVPGWAFAGREPVARAAAQAAGISAFWAPEPVPAEWFTKAAEQLPEPLGQQATDLVAWRQVLARIRQQALARLDHHGLLMHRLTQAIIRDHLPLDEAAATRAPAAVMLVASDP